MKRFTALFLAAWLVLLMGCAASRQLGQVCGAENWSSVQLVERYDRAGEEATSRSTDAVSLEALRTLLREAYAKPAHASFCLQRYEAAPACQTGSRSACFAVSA